MANIPNCPKCRNFVPATDPQIVKAYAGQCVKIEWPYTVNIPRVDGIEGECGYYEGTEPAMVAQWDLAAADTLLKKVSAVGPHRHEGRVLLRFGNAARFPVFHGHPGGAQAAQEARHRRRRDRPQGEAEPGEGLQRGVHRPEGRHPRRLRGEGRPRGGLRPDGARAPGLRRRPELPEGSVPAVRQGAAESPGRRRCARAADDLTAGRNTRGVERAVPGQGFPARAPNHLDRILQGGGHEAMGNIPESYLPPPELRPQRIYTLDEFRSIPQRFNSTEVLLDRTAEKYGDKTAIYFDDQRISYRQLQASREPRRQRIEEAGRRGGRPRPDADAQHPPDPRLQLRHHQDRRRCRCPPRSCSPARRSPTWRTSRRRRSSSSPRRCSARWRR